MSKVSEGHGKFEKTYTAAWVDMQMFVDIHAAIVWRVILLVKHENRHSDTNANENQRTNTNADEIAIAISIEI
eukprot:1393769-Amorphochlora_amoeboformis.AAC.1